MKTNDTFDFRRFGKYFRSDISTCWANYGLSLLTISILSPVFFYILSTAFNLIFKSTWDGPGIGARFLVFCIGMLCMVATMPVKCYGKLTEKQYGSFWLMLPASRLEKFISMFILTCLIAPLLGMALYLGADALLCSLDHTCGRSMIAGGIDLIRNIGDITEVTLNLADEKLTTDVILVMYENDEGLFELAYIEDGLFAVSGSLIERDYIVKSEALYDLYCDVMGK